MPASLLKWNSLQVRPPMEAVLPRRPVAPSSSNISSSRSNKGRRTTLPNSLGHRPPPMTAQARWMAAMRRPRRSERSASRRRKIGKMVVATQSLKLAWTTSLWVTNRIRIPPNQEILERITDWTLLPWRRKSMMLSSMIRIAARTKVCPTTRLEAIIQSMWVRFWWTDTSSFRSLAGAIFPQFGSQRTWSTIAMSPSKCRKVLNTIWKQLTMRLKFWTKLPRIGAAKNGKTRCRRTTRRTRTWWKRSTSMEWVATLLTASSS